jgi:hypothetical protein
MVTAPMPESPAFLFDVFLSHNSSDKPRVRRLAERLKAAGVRVWLDEWIIKPGDIIALKMDEGLEQSRVLMLCISPAALASGWVALERSSVVHRDPANAGRLFVPLLLADCVLPDTLRRYKYVDFRDESEAAFANVLATCRSEMEFSPLVSEGEKHPFSGLPFPDRFEMRIRTWPGVLKTILLRDFVSDDSHPYYGHFGGRVSATETKRWQSKGGEKVGVMQMPKLPYYYTYWGYRAARILASEEIKRLAPITAQAIRHHFGGGQWLRVIRDYSFANGPVKRAPIGETVRHTARAADLLQMLQVEPLIVSSVAWNLVRDAEELQAADGSWLEFRGDKSSSSLWSTIYVFCFFSSLLRTGDANTPAERADFVETATRIVKRTEVYLVEHWKSQRWTFGSGMPWQEGAIAVASEITEYLSDETTMKDCFNALRSLVAPSGNLVPAGINTMEDAAPEGVQALRLAFGLVASGGRDALSDSRYRMLVLRIFDSLDLDTLQTYDVTFLSQIIASETERKKF